MKKLINKTIIIAIAAVLLMMLPICVMADPQSHISISSSSENVEQGEEFVIQFSLSEMTVSTFIGGISFDEEMAELIAYSGNNGSSIKLSESNGEKVNLAFGHGDGTFGFYLIGISDRTYQAEGTFVSLKFKALKTGEIVFGIYESSDGQDGVENDTADAVVISVAAASDTNNAPVPEETRESGQSLPEEGMGWYTDFEMPGDEGGVGFTDEASAAIGSAEITGGGVETNHTSSDPYSESERAVVFPWRWIVTAVVAIIIAVVIIIVLKNRNQKP